MYMYHNKPKASPTFDYNQSNRTYIEVSLFFIKKSTYLNTVLKLNYKK